MAGGWQCWWWLPVLCSSQILRPLDVPERVRGAFRARQLDPHYVSLTHSVAEQPTYLSKYATVVWLKSCRCVPITGDLVGDAPPEIPAALARPARHGRAVRGARQADVLVPPRNRLWRPHGPRAGLEGHIPRSGWRGMLLRGLRREPRAYRAVLSRRVHARLRPRGAQRRRNVAAVGTPAVQREPNGPHRPASEPTDQRANSRDTGHASTPVIAHRAPHTAHCDAAARVRPSH